MIQELVYTSVPKGLAADSQGFCTVSCSSGMAPNLERELENLSGYRHPFLPGDDRVALNPEVYFHVIRRIGGADFHILSRVADCGVDYSQRTNKIAHHLAFEERDLLPCGPAAILSQGDLFLKAWTGPPHYVQQPRKPNNPEVRPLPCAAWKLALGDAGWAGVFAQAAEEGRPISLLFEPGMKLLPLIAEATALIPKEKRWKITFSTFFMKSQEPGRDKIQIKGILLGSEEMAYARLSPQTLIVDLLKRQVNAQLTGRYVEPARTGMTKPVAGKLPIPPSPVIPKKSLVEDKPRPVAIPVNTEATYDFMDDVVSVPIGPGSKKPFRFPGQRKSKGFPVWLVLMLIPLLIIGIAALAALFFLTSKSDFLVKKAPPKVEDKINAAEPQAAETDPEAVADQGKNQSVESAAAPVEKVSEVAATPPGGEAPPQDAKTNNGEEDKPKAEEAVPPKTEEEKQQEEEAKRKADEEAKRQAEEAAVRAIIDPLPEVWTGLDFEISSIASALDKPASELKNSKQLWDRQSEIELEYVPFVPLKKGDPENGDHPTDCKKTSNHRIEFYQQNGGEDITTGKSSPLAWIELMENGIVFKQEQAALDTGQANSFNRILLAQLRIKATIGSATITKGIALWSPAEYPLNDEDRPKLGGKKEENSFAFWKHSGPEFTIDLKTDGARILLEPDFSKVETIPKADSRELYSKDNIFYVPKFEMDDGAGKPTLVNFMMSPTKEPKKETHPNPDDKEIYYYFGISTVKLDKLTGEQKAIEGRLKQATSDKAEKSRALKNETTAFNNERENYLALKDIPEGQRNPEQKRAVLNGDMKQAAIEGLKQQFDAAVSKVESTTKEKEKKIEEIKAAESVLNSIPIKDVPFSIFLLKLKPEKPESAQEADRILLLHVK